MEQIAKLIKAYLNEWIECYYCNDMYKLSNIVSDESDNPMCKDCLEDTLPPYDYNLDD